MYYSWETKENQKKPVVTTHHDSDNCSAGRPTQAYEEHGGLRTMVTLDRLLTTWALIMPLSGLFSLDVRNRTQWIRALGVLSMCSITELYPQPCIIFPSAPPTCSSLLSNNTTHKHLLPHVTGCLQAVSPHQDPDSLHCHYVTLLPSHLTPDKSPDTWWPSLSQLKSLYSCQGPWIKGTRSKDQELWP